MNYIVKNQYQDFYRKIADITKTEFFNLKNLKGILVGGPGPTKEDFLFEIDRDFGTDYGICCWYTPQLNFTLIIQDMKQKNLSDPDWGHWFTNIPKVRMYSKCVHCLIEFSVQYMRQSEIDVSRL